MDLDNIPELELAVDTLEKGALGGKYFRRTPTGNPKRPWRYYYTREEYEQSHGGQAHIAGSDAKSDRERESRGEVKLSKKELLHKLKHGTFSIVSAGRNPAHPEEGKLAADHPSFTARHEELRSELRKRGMKYTEVEGHYGGKEKSFLVYHNGQEHKAAADKAVLVHHDSPSEFAQIRELGKKFNQDSVIHGHEGHHEMHYTVGAHAGELHKGDGHKLLPHAEDYYTNAPTKRGATKFALNFDFDKYHSAESAMHKAHYKKRTGTPGNYKYEYEDDTQRALEDRKKKDAWEYRKMGTQDQGDYPGGLLNTAAVKQPQAAVAPVYTTHQAKLRGEAEKAGFPSTGAEEIDRRLHVIAVNKRLGNEDAANKAAMNLHQRMARKDTSKEVLHKYAAAAEALGYKEFAEHARTIHKSSTSMRHIITTDRMLKGETGSVGPHKYLTRKPDGAGGYIYQYAHEGEAAPRPTKISNAHDHVAHAMHEIGPEKGQHMAVHVESQDSRRPESEKGQYHTVKFYPGGAGQHEKHGRFVSSPQDTYGGSPYGITPSSMSSYSTAHEFRSGYDALHKQLKKTKKLQGKSVPVPVSADDKALAKKLREKIPGAVNAGITEMQSDRSSKAAAGSEYHKAAELAANASKQAVQSGSTTDHGRALAAHTEARALAIKSKKPSLASVHAASIASHRAASQSEPKPDAAREARVETYKKHAKHAEHMSAGVVDSISDTHKDAADAHKQAFESAKSAGFHQRAIDHMRAMEHHQRKHSAARTVEDVHKSEGNDVMESTPHLREQIKMVIQQADPLAKGMYAFEACGTAARKIPDEYLVAYLDAFIEEAFEHEKNEKLHDPNGAVMGVNQPTIGGNGGTDGDEASYWAQWVFNELITYCGKNENIMRGCTKMSADKEFVASRLRAMGLVKPAFNGSDAQGDFMEGYMSSETTTKSLDATVSEDAMVKSRERLAGVLAPEAARVQLEDDGINPMQMLTNAHTARLQRMEEVFGVDMGIGTKR